MLRRRNFSQPFRILMIMNHPPRDEPLIPILEHIQRRL